MAHPAPVSPIQPGPENALTSQNSSTQFSEIRPICVRDDEAAGSNPAFPTSESAGHLVVFVFDRLGGAGRRP
jgi:hypothetical protein